MKIHYFNHNIYASRFQTRCGKSVDLYYQIETTTNPKEVTCKSCLRSLKPATPADTQPTTGRNQYPTGRVTK